jgi:hypothetical protein
MTGQRMESQMNDCILKGYVEYVVPLENSLLDIPITKGLRVFENRKNPTFCLWPTNLDSTITFFIWDKFLRTDS